MKRTDFLKAIGIVGAGVTAVPLVSYVASNEPPQKKWAKKAPNKPGYWIRLNAAQHPEFHQVAEVVIDGVKMLYLSWGGFVDQKVVLSKIEHFYWWQEPLAELPLRS